MDRFLKGTSSSADARAGASSSAGSSTSPAAAPMPSRAPTFEQAKADGTLQIIPAGVRCLCSLGEVHKPGWGPRGHQHDRLVARFENIDG